MTRSSADPRIHVAQVVLSLARGGSESLARDVAVTLDSARFRSSVYALDEGGPLDLDLQAAGVPVHLVGRRPGFDWRLVPRLYRLFRRERVTVVQTHHLAPLIYGALAARLAGAILIHVEHERFTFAHPTARRRLRRLARLCHRIVVVGEDIRDYFVERVGIPAAKLVVIENGVDTRRFPTTPRQSRAALGLPAEDRLIGHVARLDPAKDQATLLAAFQTLAQTHSGVRLVLVGDGALRANLEELAQTLGIAKIVTFLGARSDVAELLPHFDAFALSSVNEGLPVALLEAMAAGRPVAATAVGEIPALLGRDAGLCVPPGKPGALAEALGLLLERPEQGATMGAAARRRVEERFDLRATVRRYEAVYASLRRAGATSR
jgi:sugar transferase (PEP-CTERM/EpsH1 system associated)